MADSKPLVNLPTELINQKTFYTLGGASAAVLLICWAINFVAADVSWLTYRSYRLIGIILSEAFAIIITLNIKKKSQRNWFFAFLNGILIFVNASGLNSMTSGQIFNPKDSTGKTHSYLRMLNRGQNQQASLFNLPRMKSWWPDEGMIAENHQLTERITRLDSANKQLLLQVDKTDNEKIQQLQYVNDSLGKALLDMQGKLDDKQKQVDQLTNSMNNTGNETQQQLANCIIERNRKDDSLRACLNQQMAANGAPLTELLRQLCERVNPVAFRLRSRNPTLDEKLRQQGFFREFNWAALCARFNEWYRRVSTPQ